MSDIPEGIGAAIEGAMAGRTVEPTHGSNITNKSAQDGDSACMNCGAQVIGHHCHQCGQKAQVHRSLAAIGHDIMHGVLHLDGKLWRTLPMLALKPGELTRRYIDGERAKFVSPMAMFLFGVFAMFAVFQMVGLTTPTDLNLDETTQAIRTNGEAQAQQMRVEIAAMDADDPERAEREQELAVIEAFLNGADSSASETGDTDGGVEEPVLDLSDGRFNVSLTGFDSFDQGLVKKWQENPGLMLYKLQTNGYKFSWLLIPLSIPFVWLTFAWRRKFKAYDHAVFVTYSLSFISLLFITVSLISVTPIDGNGGWAFVIFALIAPLHLYKHLRYTYGLSRFSTIWRFCALLFFMLIVLMLFLQSLLILGAF